MQGSRPLVTPRTQGLFSLEGPRVQMPPRPRRQGNHRSPPRQPPSPAAERRWCRQTWRHGLDALPGIEREPSSSEDACRGCRRPWPREASECRRAPTLAMVTRPAKTLPTARRRRLDGRCGRVPYRGLRASRGFSGGAISEVTDGAPAPGQ
jgi:hypothetical protein